MMASLILALIAIILLRTLFVMKHPKQFPPAPVFGLPFFGNILHVGTNLTDGFRNLRTIYGDVFGLYIGKKRTVVVSDYELIQEVGHSLTLNHRQNSDGIADLRGGRVGQQSTIPGVVLSTGKTWNEQRKFALHKLRGLGLGKQNMECLVREEVRQFCQHLELTNGQPVDIRNDFNLAVINSLWTIIAGERLEYQDPKMRQLVLLMDQMFQQLGNPMTGVIFLYKPLYHMLKKSNVKTISSVVKQLVDFLQSMIKEHQETFQDDNLRDFTDHYLKEIHLKSQSGQESSFKGKDGQLNMVNVLLDLFIAGSETTSTALNWAMLFMILNPDVQQRVQEEIDAVLEDGEDIGMGDRHKTPYTEAVILEILRCGNTVPLSVVHTASEDSHLMKYFLPKKTNIYLNFEQVHKDPQNFPNPEKFDPSRYISKDGKFCPNPKVIAFGVGKRRCLGESLARTSLYLFLTGILSNFTLAKAHENDYVSLKPLPGRTLSPYTYNMRFIPRKR